MVLPLPSKVPRKGLPSVPMGVHSSFPRSMSAVSMMYVPWYDSPSLTLSRKAFSSSRVAIS